MRAGRIRETGFRTEVAAARQVAKRKGISLDKLSLEKHLRVSTEISQGRFRALFALLFDWKPRDLLFANRFLQNHPKFFSESPGLYVIALLMKEDALREIMSLRWRKAPLAERLQVANAAAPTKDLKLEDLAARSMFKVLAGAWAEWMRKDRSDAGFWQKHVHRNLTYWWTPTLLAKKLGVLGTTSAPPSFKAALRVKYVAYHRTGLILQLLPTPRTTNEYIEAKRLAKTVAKAMGLHQLISLNYQWWWVVRAHLIAKMRAHGVQRLCISGGEVDAESLRLFALPDQCKWITVWGKGASIQQLCAKLRYTGPPEYLSMYACVFNENSLMRYSEEDITDNAESIIAARRRSKRTWGWEGHPACTVQDARVVKWKAG